MRDLLGMLALISWPLAASMAFTAAGSFRRERETGVLELLLVSPISEKRIIGGRLRGLWGQFLPTVILLFGIWAYLATAVPTFWRDDRNEAAQIIWHAVTLITLPVVGLYYSLSSRHVLSAFITTLIMGIAAPAVLPFLPVVVAGLIHRSTYSFFWSVVEERLTEIHGQYGSLATALLRILLAVLLLKLMQRNLARRTFALQQRSA